MKLSTHLEIQLDGDGARVRGPLRIHRGYLQLFGETFDIDGKSTVEFAGGTPPDPVLAIAAGTVNRRTSERIDVRIAGRASAPQLTFLIDEREVTAGDAALAIFGRSDDGGGDAEGQAKSFVAGPWADGTTALVLQPLDFIARLVAAIPPPRFHMTRFHGVLSSHSTLRPLVVPKPAAPVSVAPLQLPLFAPPTSTTPACDAEPTAPRSQGRHPWAMLLRHVFAADVTACVHCKGRMRLRELCTTPSAIARALARAVLAPQPPPAPPRAPRVHPTQLRLVLS